MSKRTHIAATGKSDGGGEHATKRAAGRMHRGMKPTAPGVADRQAPHKQRAVKELKRVDEGKLKVERWLEQALAKGKPRK